MIDEANQDKVVRENGKSKIEAPRFDWVTQRSSCSLPMVFKDLLLQVEQDVKIRNGLRPNNSPYEFSVQEKGTEFVVVLKSAELRQSVVFTLTESAIIVHDDKNNLKLEVTLTFDENGKCRTHVNKEEKELWQLRRMALEKLMFTAN